MHESWKFPVKLLAIFYSYTDMQALSTQEVYQGLLVIILFGNSRYVVIGPVSCKTCFGFHKSWYCSANRIHESQASLTPSALAGSCSWPNPH